MVLAITRVMKLAAANFKRNLWLSLATIIVMVMAIAMFHVVVGIRVVTAGVLKALEEKIDVSVYLARDVSDENARAIATRLQKLPTVADVLVVTRDEALKNFRARGQSDSAITRALAEVGDNPFGATLKIRAKNVADYQQIVAALDDPAVVPAGSIERKSFSEHQTLIERFLILSQRAQRAVEILGLALLLISFFVVLNTIRITIYTHREEIGIMKLVGASNWFVRAPFLVEGALYSVVATICATVALAGILFWGGPYLTRFFAGVPINLGAFYWENALLVFGTQVLVLTALTMLGAAIAIGRYLKV